MEDFYFAYGYDEKAGTALRLYRYIGGNFERYDPKSETWYSDPDQCRIFIGEDWDYDEISEEQANQIMQVTV